MADDAVTKTGGKVISGLWKVATSKPVLMLGLIFAPAAIGIGAAYAGPQILSITTGLGAQATAGQIATAGLEVGKVSLFEGLPAAYSALTPAALA